MVIRSNYSDLPLPMLICFPSSSTPPLISLPDVPRLPQAPPGSLSQATGRRRPTARGPAQALGRAAPSSDPQAPVVPTRFAAARPRRRSPVLPASVRPGKPGRPSPRARRGATVPFPSSGRAGKARPRPRQPQRRVWLCIISSFGSADHHMKGRDLIFP